MRPVRETGKPIAQVAQDLGSARGRWELVVLIGAAAVRVAVRLSGDERAGVARLRRENAELAMRCDVLKRSVARWVSDATGR